MTNRFEKAVDLALLISISVLVVFLAAAVLAVGLLPKNELPPPAEQPAPIVHRVETPERVCYVVTYADTLLTLGCDPREAGDE